jgi:type IV pilus assembly protein PilM
MASDEKPTSIWKKEMSFRRKSAQEPAPDDASESATPSGSIWKKELSLRKKPQETPVETDVVIPEPEPSVELPVELEPAAVVVPEPELDPVLAAEPVPADPGLEPAAVVEHSWLTKPLEEISDPPEELASLPTLEAVPPLEPISFDDLPAYGAEAPEEPVGEAPTLIPFPVSLVPPEAPPVFEDVPAPAFEPEPELDLDLALPIVSEAVPELAELPAFPSIPELPAAMLPDLPELPDLPAPPAPTSEAEPAAGGEKKVPFYKREVSLKRGAREVKPKAEKTPKAPKAPKAPKPPRLKRAKADPRDAASGDKVPFYKRQLSLKRGPKEWDAAEPVSEPTKTGEKPKLKLRGPSLQRPSLPSLPTFRGSSSKKIVGLKIGGSQIAAACVSNGASRELLQAVRAPLEHGIVVGGELRDPEALAVALREFFQQHKLPKRGVRLGIANNRIGVRTFEVTGIDDPKQLANAIRFRAQEVLPIPLEEAVLDYQVLSESVNDEGQKVSRVLLVVAYRELVDRYVYACKKAGLQIVGIDLEAFALLRSIAEPHDPVPGSERGALVAVSVGHDRSTFAVSDGRVCEFTRVLEWGGWALNIAIARALDTSPSEAEPIKRALSFTGSTVALPEGFSEEHLATAHEAARRQLQTFARELVSSLQFYQNQPGSLGIGEIVLTGGTAHLPGLGAELERLIGVPVRVADPLTRLKVSKKAAEQEQLGSLAVAIGLGIEE